MPSTKPHALRLPKGAPLEYAPDNEQGVVFLFSQLALKEYGFKVERVQSGYPDCTARDRRGKTVRIEFEYCSRNFRQHGHDPKNCDCIVCWAHNWPAAPKRIRIIELRQHFGMGFNVWFQPVGGEYVEELAKKNADDRWNVPPQASKGDLILFYRTSLYKSIRDIFAVAGPVDHVTAKWKDGKDWMAPIKRVCTLKAPLHLDELRSHQYIGEAGFVKGSMRSRFKASPYWAEIRRMIIARNPSAERPLRPYDTDRIES